MSTARFNDGSLPDILLGRKSLGKYPMHKVRRVDAITTEVVGEIQRVDHTQTGFELAASGAYGERCQAEFERSSTKFPLGYALAEFVGSIFSPYRSGPVAPEKAPLPDDRAIRTEHVRSLGHFLGADLVGVCELPQWTLYSRDAERDPIVCDHKYAIVLASEWGYKTTSASLGDDWISDSCSFVCYDRTAHLAVAMAAYLRRLGYQAMANFDTGDGKPTFDMPVTPLAVLSGLGELGRAGWALNPFIGGRFKCSVVTTDLELKPDKPIDVGVQEFCKVCKKCAIDCPARAISAADQQVVHNGILRYDFDAERCTKYRIMNQNGAYCGRCVKVCPWTKPEGLTHDLVRATIRATPRLNRALVKFDDWLGYGKQDVRFKWWFDLEEVGGRHRIPKRSPDNDYRKQ
jgi:reductive dehalogenase